MALFASKNYPWKFIKGQETINTFQASSQPITSQKLIPCYVPHGMNTTPLKFPSIIMGFDRHPINVARAALGMRYTSIKASENQNNLVDQVSSAIKSSQVIRENLDNLVRLAKERMETCEGARNKIYDAQIVNLKSKIDKITLRFDGFMLEHREMQNCINKLQSCIQNIGLPLHITSECLYHRENRSKSEQINDKVEQMLMKESVDFGEKQQYLRKYLEQCDNELIRGREIQSELEGMIKNLHWNIIVNTPAEEIKKLLESAICTEHCESFLKRLSAMKSASLDLRNKIKSDMDEIIQDINKIWDDTNNAFTDNCAKLKESTAEIHSYLDKVKNEIFSIETNLKYLRTNKEPHGELQRAENQLEYLLKIKDNLELEQWTKINTLFIDEQKCMALRMCYPKAIITND